MFVSGKDLCIHRGSAVQALATQSHNGQEGALGLHLDLKSLAIRPSQQRLNLGIVLDLFGLGIPLDGTIEASGQGCQVAGTKRAVMTEHIRDRFHSVARGFEEVAEVIHQGAILVSSVQRIARQWIGF